MWSNGLLLLTLAGLAAYVPHTDAIGIATASIDLGNEWMKIGLVKPGVPMDIVLNTETKRKTNVFIGLKDDERSFAAGSQTIAVKYPKFAFGYLTELLGETIDSDAVKLYQQRFPHHTIVADANRSTVVFQVGDVAYSVEELLAQIVRFGVDLASETAEQQINSIVMTVPVYFTQVQRKAMLLVGKLAKVKILQLLNNPTAIGINYGVFRAKDFNETSRNIMFYDMGASSTVASIVSYRTVKDKKTKREEPQMELKGVGYDRTLGGVEWDYRIRDHLMAEFKKNPKLKGKGDPAKDARAMSKLLANANKVKKVLSANKETSARVEGLYDEIDFKTKFSRETLLSLSEDLFERVAAPIADALKMAKMAVEDIDELILFGGGVRIPKVQDVLKATIKHEKLGMSINGDEAACLGAVYQGAVLSKGFRLKKFHVKDGNVFPIQLTYLKPVGSGDNATTKTTTVNLFHNMNALPQKKIFRFKNMSGDFDFSLKYGDTSFLADSEKPFFTPSALLDAGLSNISAAYIGHDNDTDQGIKVHFELDHNGIIKVEKAYAQFERAPEPPKEPEKSLLGKMADGLGSLFGSSEEENATKPENATAGEADEKKDEEETATDANATDVNATDANSTSTNSTKAKPKAPKPPPPPKPTTLREAITFSAEEKDMMTAPDATVEAAYARVQRLVDIETEKKAKDSAYNELEGFIFRAKEFLESENCIKIAKDEERETVAANCTATADWLDEDGWDADAKTLQGKLSKLQGALRDMSYRVEELQTRPRAIKTMKKSLNATRDLIDRVVKINNESVTKNESLWISNKSLAGLRTVYNDTMVWFAKKQKDQANLTLYDMPSLKTTVIRQKTEKLDREAMYIAKTPKPRPRPKPKAPKNSTKTSNGTKTNSTIDSTNGTVVDDLDVNATEAPAADDADVDPVDEPAAEDAKDAKDEGAADADADEKKADEKKEETKEDAKDEL